MGCYKEWRTWRLEDKWSSSKLQQYWEQPEYWEEFRRIEKTWDHFWSGPISTWILKSVLKSCNHPDCQLKLIWKKCMELKKYSNGTQKIKLEETNQRILAKEGRLKRYRDRTKQYRQNRTLQNDEKILSTIAAGWRMDEARSTKRCETQEDFGEKYGNGKIITKKVE